MNNKFHEKQFNFFLLHYFISYFPTHDVDDRQQTITKAKLKQILNSNISSLCSCLIHFPYAFKTKEIEEIYFK